MLVDEYQDTNNAQYQLVKTLAGNGAGLTAVGDDDQSIYAWRGAQPENLNQLSVDFAELRLVKLEQNYRSMGRILSLANGLIQHNPRPFDKNLWSDLGFGDPIQVIQAKDDIREAEKVVAAIMQHHFQSSNRYGDYAILYRSNHQARVFEQKLREMNVPYYLSGGQSFFDRAEVKDVMAYMRLLSNYKDDSAFIRCINTPRRGIGAAAIEGLSAVASDNECSLYEAITAPELQNTLRQRQIAPLLQFVYWMQSIELSENSSPYRILEQLLQDIEYQQWLATQSASPEQADARWNNVKEILGWVDKLVKNDPERDFQDVVSAICLRGMLEGNDDSENDQDQVKLMTLHAAKGLEFPNVYIVGLEEEILPHRNSIEGETIEEERRLLYVGITRARRDLTLSYAQKRKRFGEELDCQPSRFIEELDQQHLVWRDKLEETPEVKEAVGRSHLDAMRALLNG
jgi:ATP-dependent DNA helicase Rep